MNFDEIKEYWNNRATVDVSIQSTTQDVYMREIEWRVIFERIQKYTPKTVIDIGCGDGVTTMKVACGFSNVQFEGYDYALAMIDNANNNLKNSTLRNVCFKQGDILVPLTANYELAYTTRCLINLPSWDMQKIALTNIHDSLLAGGRYLMIENFIEGHNNFNEIRKNYDLPEIPVRNHNRYFRRSEIAEFITDKFLIEEEINISSTYYLVSRIIYSKICLEKNLTPDYFDEHHKLSTKLPFLGNYGPVNLLVLKKRS